MQTNEELRKTLMSLAETGMETLVLSLEGVAEGNLQELEQQILVQFLALGRTCLEQTMEHQAKREGSAARREGACGHRQHLVGTRLRQVLTLLGPMTIFSPRHF